jgi:glycosyltransferase involved in cell wall biosynthesis
MSSPKVSVVIPTYNRPDLLSRAIESVLNQTYTNYECIIVDDASCVDTSSVIKEFNDGSIRYFEHEKNQGASAARNTGIEHAKGEYIAFLDDDDEWLPEKIAKQVDLFDRLDSDYGLVYCWMVYRQHSDSEVIKEYCPEYRGYIFPHTLDGQPIGSASTLLVRKDVAEKTKFDVSLPRGNDGDFIRRICREYKVEYIPEILVNYYVSHGNIRITREDEQGIRNAIKGHKVKLEKFENELKNHPDHAALIYARIAYHYGELGEWIPSVNYYRQAILTSPMSSPIYKLMLSSIKSGMIE